MVPANASVVGGCGDGGGEGERTEEVDVAFVRCGEFEKLAREVLVDWSVLNYC
jgi:hypothetical protein